MTLIPFDPITLSPREELVHEIAATLDSAITSDEPMSVHEVAELIVGAVEDHGYSLDPSAKPRVRVPLSLSPTPILRRP